MKSLIFFTLLSLPLIASPAQSSQPLEEFRVNEGQTVSEIFRALASASEDSQSFQILISPEVAEKKLGDLRLRNMPIDQCINHVCWRFGLTHTRKGNLYLITGSSDAMQLIYEELNRKVPSLTPLEQDTQVGREVPQMPIFGERIEFDMVWEMEKELRKLHQRIAALENSAEGDGTETPE